MSDVGRYLLQNVIEKGTESFQSSPVSNETFSIGKSIQNSNDDDECEDYECTEANIP